MKHSKLNSLIFLASVALLLLNDLYLKYEFHNVLTGKLSDFAGLFAFPYFFAVFFPRGAKAIYIAVALLFTVWKSELIQPLLNLAHAYGLGFNRVVDYTDLIALSILPLSYKHFIAETKLALRIGIIGKPVIVAVCCFAFVATSTPKEIKEVNLSSGITAEVKATKQQLMEKAALQPWENGKYIISLNPKDKDKVSVTAVVSVAPENENVQVRLDTIKSYVVHGSFLTGVNSKDVEAMEDVTLQEYQQYFYSELVKLFGKEAVVLE